MGTWDEYKLPDEACAQCGAVYSVTSKTWPSADSWHCDCEVCGHRMREWTHSTTDYTYTLKHRPESKNEPSK